MIMALMAEVQELKAKDQPLKKKRASVNSDYSDISAMKHFKFHPIYHLPWNKTRDLILDKNELVGVEPNPGPVVVNERSTHVIIHRGVELKVQCEPDGEESGR